MLLHVWVKNERLCQLIDKSSAYRGEGNGTPLQYSCLGKSPGRRSVESCSPWGCWGSDTIERLHFHFSLSCIGEGNGNPLQCSCLENPRDWGAWWAAVSGVAQNRTRLKRLSSSSSSSSIIWNVTHTPKKQQLEVITFQVLVFCLFEWPKPLFQKDLSFQWSCFSFDCWCFPLSLTTGHESSKRLQIQYSLLPLYESNPISSCYSRSITPANRFFILLCWFDG